MMEFTEKDNILYLKSGRVELYVLQRYVDSKVTSIHDDIVHTLGYCIYKFYKDRKDTKPSKIGVMNIPTMVPFYPIDIRFKVTDTIWDGIYKYSNENVYMVLEFEMGHRMMDKLLVQNLNNVTIFADLILGGKLDNNIPYDYISDAWMKNMIKNGIDLQVPASVIDLIIYELCRDIKTNKPFGFVYGKDRTISPVSYKFANIREICASNSVFAALAFEDLNSMIDSSLNMTSQGKEQKISPVEQIIKM